jgi:hypothetical protein
MKKHFYLIMLILISFLCILVMFTKCSKKCEELQNVCNKCFDVIQKDQCNQVIGYNSESLCANAESQFRTVCP